MREKTPLALAAEVLLAKGKSPDPILESSVPNKTIISSNSLVQPTTPLELIGIPPRKGKTPKGGGIGNVNESGQGVILYEL